jgi:NHLM bacteriocin system ABC transporter ATP-binding protein
VTIEIKEQPPTTSTAPLEQQVMHQALHEIASVLTPVPAAPVAANDAQAALLHACQSVGTALGVTIRVPRSEPSGAATRDPLVAIARASHLRLQHVALCPHWWRDDGGPLLGFMADGQRPVALLPRGPGRYQLYDTFFRPLPAGPLTLGRFVRWGLRGSTRDMLVLLATGALISLLGMAAPLLTQVIVDTLIPVGARREVLLLSALLLVVAAVAALLQVGRNLAATRIETRLSAALQHALWDRLLALPVPFFRRYSAGGLATRAMSIETIRLFLTGLTVPVLLPAVFALVQLALLFYYDVWLGALGLVLTFIAAGVALLAGVVLFRSERNVQELLPNLAGLVVQLIHSIPKLRIAAAEGRAFGVWSRTFVALQQAVLKVRQITALVVVWSTIFPLLSTMAIFGALALRGGGETYSTGTFLAFSAAFNALLAAVLALSINVYKLARIGALLAQQQPLLAAQPEADRGRLDPGALTGAISISRVTFRYRADGPPTLSDVSLTAQPGQFVAIVGPSGSGKSTLIRLLLGFETPQTGALYYDEQNLADLELSAVRRQIGVVLQHDRLMPGTLADNIVGLSLLTEQDAWQAAELVGMADEIRRLPRGMQTLVSEADSTFSGGQLQRLLLARAVAARPRILIFDEATSALDNHTQEAVTRSLEQLQATRIVIAHRLSTIKQADQIYVLAGGNVVQQGTYGELAHAHGTFRELVRRQQFAER